MARLDDEIEQLEARKKNTRFGDLVRLCREYFGRERIKRSHHIFKTPWPGDPRIKFQEVRGKAKPYQVDQVIAALDRLKETDEAQE
jgi:hypothetical protein